MIKAKNTTSLFNFPFEQSITEEFSPEFLKPKADKIFLPAWLKKKNSPPHTHTPFFTWGFAPTINYISFLCKDGLIILI